MAKRGSKSHYNQKLSRRVTNVRRYSRRNVGSIRLLSLSSLPDPVLDRRTFHPLGPLHRPLTKSWKAPSRLVERPVAPFRPTTFSTAVPAFADPGALSLCQRRRARKQVILATGRGGGRHRKPRRNSTSNLSCR